MHVKKSVVMGSQIYSLHMAWNAFTQLPRLGAVSLTTNAANSTCDLKTGCTFASSSLHM